jgi:transcription elongation factor GreB
MGRWKPPAEKSSPYITPEGFAVLEAELKALWLRRRDVVQALAAAAAEGDRSENAEYHYRKKELGGIDRRIRYLQKRLPDLTVVRESPKTDRVFFGAWITLESDADGAEVIYRIVGADEAEPGNSKISMDSPLAKAMLKKTLDDEITITQNGKSQIFYITAVRYGE